MPSTWGISRFGLAAALSVVFLLPQNTLDDLRGRYTKETDPVRKAKLLPKLGDAEFVASLEKDLGRILTRKKPGPKGNPGN